MLEVKNLTKRFGGFTAVDNVDFAVERGEILGLIGPNGSGKSTIFNMLAGALDKTSGSIKLDGVEIAGMPAHACQPYTYTYQHAGPPIHILKTLRDDRRPLQAFGVCCTKKKAGDARRIGF